MMVLWWLLAVVGAGSWFRVADAALFEWCDVTNALAKKSGVFCADRAVLFSDFCWLHKIYGIKGYFECVIHCNLWVSI